MMSMQRPFVLRLLALALIIVSMGAVVTSYGQSSKGDKLGCQKNNPTRVDCSSLEVTGVCEGNVAVFTIRNTGEAGDGDMRSATQYTIVVDGVAVETGPVQIAGGATMQVTYAGGGNVTLYATQQVGHPGSSQPQTTLNCGQSQPTQVPPTVVPPTATTVPPTEVPPTQVPPTEVPPTATTVPPTEVPPTEVPPTEVLPTETPSVQEPILDVYAYCEDAWTAVFTISNLGADMPNAEWYYIIDEYGNMLQGDWLQLAAGDHLTIYQSGYSFSTLIVGDNLVYSPMNCAPPTEEPNPSGDLSFNAYCAWDGLYPVFTITNYSWEDYEDYYQVRTVDDGYVVDEGWLRVWGNSEVELSYPDWIEPLILNYGGYEIVAECFPPYQEPTEEPTEETPTEEPVTEEPVTETPVPPTEVPATEVPPTEVPPTATQVPPTTPVSTQLGCQKNNPGRLDCSSLEVTAVCQGSTAVFTITNTGEYGDGNMRAATEYRILVGKTVVQSGSVQLLGNATMQVTYSGTGKITLQADQQIGHPGKSLPQASVTCK
jgi:predicted RNA-binding protein with TRAM domain